MTIFQQGDRVRTRYAGRQADGVVMLASSNGRSLWLEFDAMLGGFVGRMPVLAQAGGFIDVIHCQPVELERIA
jgi:hypothetical protein